MGFSCAIADCANSENVNVYRENLLIFHRFLVKNPSLCKVWILKCKRKKSETHYICSDHFVESDYLVSMRN